MKSISTARGDGGETDLLSGERIAKDHPRIEALGDLDELTSFLGDAKCAAAKSRTREILEALQTDLMGLMGGIALSPEAAAKENFTARAEPAEKRIRDWVHEFEAAHPRTGFVLPGQNPAAAKIDIARAAARRAERRVIALNRREPVSPAIRSYLNRLSDLLYVLARCEED